MNEATHRQIDAARPDVSTWLSANAGSGKTRVLTNRVARLLLSGVSPQHILCLTYTKAAASEMQNRLFATLGTWAMLDDAALSAALSALGESGTGDLDTARRLFAQAIETPGGLRIQTIHAFCASVLRRFPLEAGVSPSFAEMDDRAAAQLRDMVLDDLARAAPDLFDRLSAEMSEARLDALVSDMLRHRDGFGPGGADLRAALGLPHDLDAESVVHEVFTGGEAEMLADLHAALLKGGKSDEKMAPAVAAIRPPWRLETLAACERVFLTGASTNSPFSAKTGKIPTRAGQAHFDAQEALDAFMERVEAARERRVGLVTLRRTQVIHDFARAFLPRLDEAKLARGWLDFDDLIRRARDLLRDREVADWVLYRLDGGIDHILVDEAQDTAPAQWEVIDALAREFAAGDGRRPASARTIFVVGDRKQSIYSFQGADPDGFADRRAAFAGLLGDAGLAERSMLHSFRSSAAILSAVDATFAGPDRLGGEVAHLAFHADRPGRVDLWPLEPAGEEAGDLDWDDPVDRVSDVGAVVKLADAVAREIRRMIDAGTLIPDGQGGARPVHAGDFLILVRSRGPLFVRLIAACKARGIAIAGADRLKLSEQLAVRDLRALLAFLVTPEDDLSLATVLRSPLFGWSQEDLFRLAHGRRGFLWQALRAARDTHSRTIAVLDDLLGQVDFLRPFDMIDRVLTRHDGRARLIGRLGVEAEEAIDALLGLALDYEQVEAPSLTGFLAWFDADDAEVKRQAEGRGEQLRIMSVHGAKGLEERIVILPDTMRGPDNRHGELCAGPGGHVFVRPSADERPAAFDAPLADAAAAEAAERDRLLYVAMTRAETWLIVCGTEAKRSVGETWYRQVEAGLDRLGTVPLDTPCGPGRRLTHGDWPTVPTAAPPPTADAEIARPRWMDRPPPSPPAAPVLLSPSDLGGAKVVPGETDAAPDALARGTQIHLLLEELGGVAPGDWPERLRALGLDALPAPVIAEAQGVVADPQLSPLFAASGLTEVALAAPLASGRIIHGTIDRLVVDADRVLAIDYKTNAVVPASPESVPDGLLRQMGAYDAALTAIYPGRLIETALLWTAAPRLMRLPQDLVARAFAAAA